MTWLNWSLKLHIRLRTISFWYPHISHMSMFKECHIHLCDCTWLNVFHILNFCWLNTKRFLSVLIVFGKFFCFCKKSKISKTVLPCSSDLVASQASRMPQLWAYTVGLRDSLTGQSPSHKKYLEIFSKIWVFRVLATRFGDFFAGGRFSLELTQGFSRLPSWISRR